MKLHIIYIHGEVITFKLESDPSRLYYLKTGPSYPELYNDKLIKLIVPNIDEWFLSNTQLNYSYDTVLKMAAAFIDGTKIVNNKNVDELLRSYSTQFITELFHNYKWFLYKDIYDVECMSEKEIASTISTINEHISIVKNGDKAVNNFLNRIWRLVSYKYNNLIYSVQIIYNYIGMTPSDPQFPESDHITNNISNHIIKLHQIKSTMVSQDVIKNSIAIADK